VLEARYSQQHLSEDERTIQQIEALALKARFSQHRISEDERTFVVTYATELADSIYCELNLPGRLRMKYLRALY